MRRRTNAGNTLKLVIEYEGTAYGGWQIQKNARSVQGALEEVLNKIFHAHIRVIGASRTDQGVHARGQTAHCLLPSSCTLSPHTLVRAMNAYLPMDIRVLSAEEADPSFHAQLRAKSKVYQYTLFNQKIPSVFGRNFFWYIPSTLDIRLMRREMKCLLGTHDFKSFQAKDKKERSSVRTIYSLKLVKKGPRLIFEIEGNGFLYTMVRVIVGTLVDIGRGKLPGGSMERILKAKNRAIAGPTAPPQGLCLEEVKY